MKVRQGFVSNSSSSSFIIAWPNTPLSAEDISISLFGNTDGHYPHPYADLYEDESAKRFSLMDVANFIFQSLNWNAGEVHTELIGEFENKIKEILYDWRSRSRKRFIFSEQSKNEYISQLEERYPEVSWKNKFAEILQLYNTLYNEYDTVRKEESRVFNQIKNKYGAKKANSADDLPDFSTYLAQQADYIKIKEIAIKKLKALSENKKLNSTITLIATKLTEIFFINNAGCTITQCEIGDDSTLGSAIEHGPIFDKLTYLKFSHH